MNNFSKKNDGKKHFSTNKPFNRNSHGTSSQNKSAKYDGSEKQNKPKPKFTRETILKPKQHSSKLENHPIRLNKAIADSGLTSRRNADELITSGVVKVNGVVVTTLGTKVNSDDRITVRGNAIPENDRKLYFVMNKPKDVIVSVKDEKDRTTVLDLMKLNARIFPVGRLDRNTTGVLLLTNDGELAHRLLHPSYEVERTYSVLLDKELSIKDAEHISKGVDLEDGRTAPCKVYFDPRSNRKVILTLKEGRNHEVKRIFMHLGYNVKQLDRKVFAGISSQRMAKGEFRQLTKKEINFLKKIVGIDI